MSLEALFWTRILPKLCVKNLLLETLIAVGILHPQDATMKKKNTCQWLIVSSPKQCGKSCIFEMCKQNRAQLRPRPNSEPKPCRRCGVGTQSECQLCPSCGANRVSHLLANKEKRTRRIHVRLMRELELAVLQPKGAGGVNYPSTARNFPFSNLVPQCYTRREVSIALLPPWIFHLETWFLNVILDGR